MTKDDVTKLRKSMSMTQSKFARLIFDLFYTKIALLSHAECIAY
jgi:hypothetical protein